MGGITDISEDKEKKKPQSDKRVFNTKMSAGNQQKFIQPLKMQANVSEKK